ncbi:MAG: DUF3618 domain-containing protein [Actinocatenispora sp.]
MGAHPEEMTPEMIRERMADTRAAMTANIEQLRDRVSPRALVSHRLSGARKKLHGAGDRVAHPLHKASSGTRGAIGGAGHTTARVPAQMRRVTDTMRRQLTERPMLIGLAALLLGAAAAALLPGRSRRQ